MGIKASRMFARRSLRLVDYYDALVLLGRLHAGRCLAAAAGLSPMIVLERTVAAANETCFWERAYKPLCQALRLRENAIPEWPPRSLDDWDHFCEAVQQAAQRPSDPMLEQLQGFARLAFMVGYLLWVNLDGDLVSQFKESLYDLRLPEDVVDGVLAGVREPDVASRLEAIARIRTHLALHGGQVEIPPLAEN